MSLNPARNIAERRRDVAGRFAAHRRAEAALPSGLVEGWTPADEAAAARDGLIEAMSRVAAAERDLMAARERARGLRVLSREKREAVMDAEAALEGARAEHKRAQNRIAIAAGVYRTHEAPPGVVPGRVVSVPLPRQAVDDVAPALRANQ